MQRHTHTKAGSGVARPYSQPRTFPPGHLPFLPAEACHFPLRFQLLSIMPEGQCLAKACLSGRTIATEAGTGLGFRRAPRGLPLGPQDRGDDIGGENDTTILQVPDQDPTETSRHITGAGSEGREGATSQPPHRFLPLSLKATPLSHLFLAGPRGTSETAPLRGFTVHRNTWEPLGPPAALPDS